MFISVSTLPHDWDAAAYQRLSDPQFEWGTRVLASMSLRGDETVIDVGCGSARLTAALLNRLPGGRVIATDISPSMIKTAEDVLLPRFGARVQFVRSDALDLEFDAIADVVFSTAVFHWILDHDRLFQRILQALRRGGRLIAQCGGGPNLKSVRDRVDEVASSPGFSEYFQNYKEPWLFASAEQTDERLRRAGFVDVRTWVEPAPVVFDSAAIFREFLQVVVLRPALAVLPVDLRSQFLSAVIDRLTPSRTLDYWRLNIRARKPDGTTR